MKLKYLIKTFCLAVIIIACGFLTACDLPSNNGGDNTPPTHFSIIKSTFKCTEEQATEIEKVLDKCEIKIQDREYVSRDKQSDIDSSFAYKVKYNITNCDEHEVGYFYIHLDYDKKVKHIQIWSEFLYKNYTFKKTFAAMHEDIHEPLTVKFNMGLKNIIFRGETTQSVGYGKYATPPTFYEGTVTYANFLGWTVNGFTTVNVEAYKITENTVFTALWKNTIFFETNTFLPSGENAESTDNIDLEATRTTGNWRG